MITRRGLLTSFSLTIAGILGMLAFRPASHVATARRKRKKKKKGGGGGGGGGSY